MEELNSETKDKYQQTIEVAQSKVLPPEESVLIRNKSERFFELTNVDRALAFYGSTHSNDSGNPMFEEIRQKFTDFKPDIVLVEGVGDFEKRKKRIIAEMSKVNDKQVINNNSEPGFVMKLAVDNNVDFDCPEPEWSNEIMSLEVSGFSKESIFAQQFFQRVRQYCREIRDGVKFDFNEEMNDFVGRFQMVTNWPDFDYSINHADEISKKTWGRGIDVADLSFYDKMVDPLPWPGRPFQGTEIKKAARESTILRDKNIVARIAETLKKHKRIFVVYGKDHAVSQKPALEYLFANLE